MARKTVISKVLDADAQDGIIEFPQNRTSMQTSLLTKHQTLMMIVKASNPKT